MKITVYRCESIIIKSIVNFYLQADKLRLTFINYSLHPLDESCSSIVYGS